MTTYTASLSNDAEAAEIETLFRMKLSGLRRRLRPSDIPAAVRALRAERNATLKAIYDRRADQAVARAKGGAA